MDRNILAAEHAAAQDTRRKSMRLVLIIAIALIVICAGVAALVDPIGGLVFFIGLSGILGLVVLMVWVIGLFFKVDGPSPNSPLSFAQVYTPMPAPMAWQATLQRLALMQLPHHQTGPTTVQANKTMDLLSFGSTHLVDVRPSSDRPGLTVVTILATPSVPTTMTDYGRNAKVNNEIFGAVL